MEKATQELELRADRLADTIKILQNKIEQIKLEGEIAPPGCFVLRYRARGKTKTYWYYKLQAASAIFPTKSGELSKYKHLGVAGSAEHIEALMQVTRRTQLEALTRSYESLIACWSDLYEGQHKPNSQ